MAWDNAHARRIGLLLAGAAVLATGGAAFARQGDKPEAAEPPLLATVAPPAAKQMTLSGAPQELETGPEVVARLDVVLLKSRIWFDPNDFKRTLVLGDTDEWELQIDPNDQIPIGHPFHIHVNPFEVMAVTNKAGAELTDDPASQYFGMKGVFKDTVFVEPGVVVRIRSHYRRYIGDFVLHCHILNHEDAGMMEMVRIADRGPDGKPLLLGHGLTDVAETEPAGTHPGH